MIDDGIDPWFTAKASKARGGRLHPYERIDPTSTALGVVDMQNYFVDPDLAAFGGAALKIVPQINRLAGATRAAGGRVIWIRTEAPDDPNDWANRAEASSAEKWERRRRLLSRGGAGFPIHPECDVRPEDWTVTKTRYSAFIPYPSEFDTRLREADIETVLITGIATSSCCESTARDASMWGYRTIMISDACVDQTPALHNHALGKFLVTFGDVRRSEQVQALLDSATRAPG